jgi:hypothetical protein
LEGWPGRWNQFTLFLVLPLEGAFDVFQSREPEVLG